MKIFPNTIINFHAIDDQKWIDSTFNLLKNNYQLVSLQDIKQYYYSKVKLSNSCHITFDDGDYSFYKNVYPLIIKHRIPVSIYVSPEVIKNRTNFWFQEIRGYDQQMLRHIISEIFHDKTFRELQIPIIAIFKSISLKSINDVISRYQKLTNTPPKPTFNISYPQLKEIYNSGLVSIGAHTQNHPILKNETDEVAEYEIVSSVVELSEMLDSKVEFFAFPNGIPGLDFGQREINYLKQAGICLSFSTENKTFTSKDNPLAIPRNGLSYGNSSFTLFKLIMGSRWDSFKRAIKGKQEIDYRKMIQKNSETTS